MTPLMVQQMIFTAEQKQQALTLQHFQRRWRDEYLTSLGEFSPSYRKNKQTIKVGDVVLVHDDAPQVSWKMAVIEETNQGKMMA